MSITLQLAPETEQRLRVKAAAEGKSVEEYLALLAESSINSNGPTAPLSNTQEKTPEQRVAELLAWVNSHKPLPYIADDSRESIYAGRGE